VLLYWRVLVDSKLVKSKVGKRTNEQSKHWGTHSWAWEYRLLSGWRVPADTELVLSKPGQIQTDEAITRVKLTGLGRTVCTEDGACR
jgi:hypothetical protein